MKNRKHQTCWDWGVAREPLHGVFAVGTALAALVMTRPAVATTAVATEAVDHYCGSSIVCIAEADNYRNGLLTAPGTIFTSGTYWTEQNVWDIDFADNDITASGVDDDNVSFDMPGSGTAYVCLHGNGANTSTTSCTSAAQCSSGGVCIGHGPPNNSPGWCEYDSDRNLINDACAYYNYRGGYTDYSANLTAWGESSVGKGCRSAAGTNGGINFGLLSNSYGTQPGFWWRQMEPLFGGMQVLGIVMPVTPQGADDVDAPARGTALSDAYRTNPNGSIGAAWVDSIVGIPQNDGGDCPGMGGSYQYGGGHGIAGCGAQLAYSIDATSSKSIWNRDSQTWNQISGNSYDATGCSYWAARWHRNYDCNSYPFTL